MKLGIGIILAALTLTVAGHAADAPKVSGKERPDLKITTTMDGKQQFYYHADIQKDKGAKDALSTGEFREMGVEAGHVNGIFGAPTVYSFELPAGIATIAASATFGNHANNNENYYRIAYSTDGQTFAPLVEKTTTDAGNVVLEGQADLPAAPRQIWLKFEMTSNPFITFKQFGVTLTLAK